MSTMDAPAPAVHTGQRHIGPYSLLRLIGKSAVGMVWLAQASAITDAVLLYLPRQPLPNAQALTDWQQTAGRMARIQHPQLARILGSGADGLWPYLILDHEGDNTVAQRVGSSATAWPSPDIAVQWMVDGIEGLAALHDAGMTHADIGHHSLLIDGAGRVRLLPPAAAGRSQEARGIDRDLVMSGLLLHGLLLHRPALDQSDISIAASTIDQDIVRLPWTTPRSVPEALRAIVNRATDHHSGRRFVSARGFLRALKGWSESDGSSGAIAQLLAHLPHAGLLPAMPGLSNRMARLISYETGMDAMVDVVTEDPALTFELLRLANAAGAHGGDEGVVISPRRAIQLMGLDGLRRAASGLKSWPGVLGEDRCETLGRAMNRLRWMSYTAAELSPPGLRREEPSVVAFFQGLGPLLVLYHFPEEAQQITTLVEGGMPRIQAACAVLGTDDESLALAVVRQWGWRDSSLELVRRFNAARATSRVEHLDWLRCMANAADEALQMQQSHEHEAMAYVGDRTLRKGMPTVALKYQRILGASSQELHAAVVQAQLRTDAAHRRDGTSGSRLTVSTATGPMFPSD